MAAETAFFVKEMIECFWFQDVEQLAKALPNVVGVYLIPNPKFNHFDFLWARDAKKLLYDPMMALMAKY